VSKIPYFNQKPYYIEFIDHPTYKMLTFTFLRNMRLPTCTFYNNILLKCESSINLLCSLLSIKPKLFI